MATGSSPLRIHLAGSRFDDGRIPTDFLRDIAALGDAMREAAKASYLERHQKRRNVPQGFAEDITPSITATKTNSVMVEITPGQTGVGGTSSLLLMEPAPYWDDACAIVLETLSNRADTQYDNPRAEARRKASQAKLHRFGANLRDGEIASVSRDGEEEVIYDLNRRRAYSRRLFPTDKYTETGSLVGTIHAVDSRAAFFNISLPNNTTIKCDTPDEHREEIREAWVAYDKGQPIEATVHGDIEYGSNHMPIAISNILDISLLHPLDINRQIQCLQQEHGLVALNTSDATWLRHALLSKAMLTDANLPYLSIATNGDVRAEWITSNQAVELTINIETRQAHWEQYGVNNAEALTMQLDLEQEGDWLKINDALADIAVEAEPLLMTTTTPAQLRAKLRAAFQEVRSEPGTDHPIADSIISALTPTPLAIAALTFVASDRKGGDPYLAWATLIRIAHTDLPWSDNDKANLIRQALQSLSPMVRDGAIQVAETWAEPFILEVLNAHQESHERLAAYVSEVTSDVAALISMRSA